MRPPAPDAQGRTCIQLSSGLRTSLGDDMSKTMRKAVVLFTLFAALALLVGCPQGTTVADINRNPGRYYNKEVAVSGNVVSSFGLLGTGGYELDDSTVFIWVMIYDHNI